MINIRKSVPWVLTHTSALILLVLLLVYPSEHKILTTYSGYFGVAYLTITLALNPLIALGIRGPISFLNRYRRQLGVAAFSHIAVHLTCYLIKKGGIAAAFPFFFHPALIPVVWIGFPLLFALAITSNKLSIKSLTFNTWKKLHKTVYLVEIAVIIHLILLGKTLWAALIFAPLIVLQLARKRVIKNRKTTMERSFSC